jgi:hypothetical protein
LVGSFSSGYFWPIFIQHFKQHGVCSLVHINLSPFFSNEGGFIGIDTTCLAVIDEQVNLLQITRVQTK